MERHCSSSFDRISELPCNISQTILMCLTLEDMVRTSVLSRNWRFQWTRVPQLLFDNDFKKRYTAERVLGILLLHDGPIFKFTLDISEWDNSFKIDEIIRYLSRNRIRDLTISRTDDEIYTLPSSIFSCIDLKYLSLYSCVFEPLTLVGFNKLITLELLEVELDSHVSISSCPLLESLTVTCLTYVVQFSVDAPRLKTFSFRGTISCIGFMNTPLLKALSFTWDDRTMYEASSFDLIKVLCSLPHLENLELHFMFLKLLPCGVSPNKLPTVLNSLRKLELLFVNLQDKEDLSSTLWLIRNSPNLQILILEEPLDSAGDLELDLETVDYSDCYLMKLQAVQLVFYDNVAPCYRPTAAMQLLKLLLDVSPVLEKLYVHPYSKHPNEAEFKEMLDLACHPRASGKAEIVFNLK